MLKEMIKPDFAQQKNFANIPGTVLEAFGVAPRFPALNRDIVDLRGSDKDVLLVYLDNFGWHIFEQLRAELSFLQRYKSVSKVSRITSQFPSNTGGHATTIYTGVPAFMTGFYEFRVYSPVVDDIVMPLRFMRINAAENDSLIAEGFAPEAVLPTQKLYDDLAAANVRTHTVIESILQNSAYNQYFAAGARNIGFEKLPESMASLQQIIAGRDRNQRNYFYYYYDGPDKSSHHFGPGSAQHRAEVQGFFLLLEKYVLQELEDDELTVLICSDHGQIDVSEDTTMYLDRELPELLQYMKVNGAGETLEAAGNSRDLFLHVRPGAQEAAYDLLKAKLNGFATVYKQAEFIQDGWFGDPPAEVRQNFADIIIIPLEKNNVAWAGKKDKDLDKKGMHGGAHPDEMYTPFIWLDL